MKLKETHLNLWEGSTKLIELFKHNENACLKIFDFGEEKNIENQEEYCILTKIIKDHDELYSILKKDCPNAFKAISKRKKKKILEIIY
ncbi:MAG: hypothetical protein ACRC4M_02735 [Mycoplasma sp.]